jgi:hypothetical protein
MVIAQKYAKFVDYPFDWALFVAIGAFEIFAGMSIGQAQSAQAGRASDCVRCPGPRGAACNQGEKQTSLQLTSPKQSTENLLVPTFGRSATATYR